jgi:hypothetical protein
VQGSIGLVTDAIARNAIPANVPGSSPDVTFWVNSPLNFNIGESGAETVGAFLASGGAFGITENTAGALTTPGNNTLWLFEALVAVVTGPKLNVTHDDGLTLIIGGFNLGFFNPGPAAPARPCCRSICPS